MPFSAKNLDLSKLEYAVGRENCDINLTTDEKSFEHLHFISRTHFKLKRDSRNSLVYLEDFSRNGTFINGEKVDKGNQRILQNEDVIAIGSDFRKLFRFFYRFTHTVDKIPNLIKDDYYISRLLGSGACGAVRLIINKSTCDKFTMKQIIKSKADGEKKLNHPNRIMKEINIMKKLDHPFIVSIYNIVETPEAVFLILELMNGGDKS
ncbi:ovarian-specific serine/threonine-protein kinase Lok-like [Ctenocephalides felis]|uniref:ovarian-specific serine/threonine-protein kinase Lok-like n=1 Tax=Ctenocephalides felis TaxID=7515 RepID=UPI000E6E416B|nr:ovarian-specific serine/threonine-protein kinase Lok-like [Ctenocephalides felis]